MELAKRIGPYLLLEMLLPGGTLLAVLLYLYRRKVFSRGMSILRRAIRL
jgi:hypothetical protein